MKLGVLIALGLIAGSGAWAAPTATAEAPVPSRAPLSEVPALALRELGRLIPIGTPQNAAVWTLQNQGFAVSIVHGFFGGERFPKYLYCDYRQIGVHRYRRWQVAVVIENGRIADYRVLVGN